MSSHIQIYLQSIATQLQTGNATEHTHRPALQNLLTALLPHYRITNEPRRIACGSPDFEIAKDDVPIGHLEAKDIGVDLEKVQHTEQLKRYLPSLNNLLLTDYLEFRWFVEGEYRPEMTVRLAVVAKNGQLKPLSDNFPRFDTLLKTFVETQIITLRSPEELAHKLAHLAQQIKRSILLAYHHEEKADKLHQQLESLRSVLIDTLKEEEFSDMMAQTVCYGLFAAKCGAGGQPFSRLTAIHFVPKTNPFLRNLFNQIAGIELDDRLVWMVDHLVAVLNRVDMAAILENFGKRTRQEDPVVHFYETFLAHYDAKLRDVRGVYYTPEPVVSYIVRSVDWVLKEKFGLKQGLADNTQLENDLHKVQILDPATGTGTFLYAVVAKIYERFRRNQGMWSDYVSKHLLPRVHGFELLMAPYTVAHLKLSLQLQATGYDFVSKERLRVFLTNTLDMTHEKGETKSLPFADWLLKEGKSADGLKSETPIMVILGNPPYSGLSANTGEWIAGLLRGVDSLTGKKTGNYFVVDGHPLNERKHWLNDDYVKFIRFAQWRIEQTGYGVLAFVTNHGYLDNPTFRGMRQSLMQEFDDIYILDLHGNSKKKEKSPDGSVDQNVFDIQQGVAIGIFVKHQTKDLTGLRDLSGLATVHHAHLYGDRAFKYQYLMEKDLKTTPWTELQPQSPFYLLVPQDITLLPEYEQGWKITDAMPINSSGIVTARDSFVIDFDDAELEKRLREFTDLSIDDNEIRQKYFVGKGSSKYVAGDTRGWKLPDARRKLSQENWKSYLSKVLYRPFDKRSILYTPLMIDWPRPEVMQHLLQGENLGLITCRQQSQQSLGWGLVSVTNSVIEGCAISNKTKEINTLFPLYLYPSEKDQFINGNGNGNGKNQELPRKPNFAEDFIKDLETRLDLQLIPEGQGDFEKTISALDVFNYLYAIFHSPTYRQRYAEFLKMDFPRLPLTSDQLLFKQLAELGGQLVQIHLMAAEIENDCSFPIQGSNLVEKLAYKEEKVYINQTQYFDHVTPEVWEFHIGGYQVCEKWLKDRKGRVLSFEDCSQYLYILATIEKTRTIMEKIDETIPNFPI
jgi:predicted helicase